eukprot:jgi/Tetstr1/428621/TSEL_018610.t1
MPAAMTARAAAPARFVGMRRAAAPAPRAATLAAPLAGRPAAGRRALQVSASVVAEPVSLTVKGLDGSSKGSENLALKVVEDDKAKGLVHRYIVTVRQNARQGTASTKTRAEVRGGGRKPVKQKGTGMARQGSTRTPLKPGGGVVFGPKPKDWTIKMNQKERQLAMGTALQNAACDMVVVDGLESFSEVKTKSLVDALSKVGVDVMSEHAILLTNGKNENVFKSGKNVKKLCIADVNNVNIYDLLRADKVVVEQPALAVIQEKYGA